jgi:GTP-binding protein
MKVYRSLQAATVKEEKPASLRRVYRYHGEEGFRVDRDGNTFTVEGEAVERLVKKLNLESHDAWEYLSERLRKMGVFKELDRRGFASGDLLRIGGVELELRD